MSSSAEKLTHLWHSFSARHRTAPVRIKLTGPENCVAHTHTCSPAHISTYKTAFSALKSWGLKVVWRGGSGTSAAQKKPGRYFSSSFMCGGLHTKSFPILVPTLIFSRAKNVSSPTSRRHTLFPSISWSRLLLFAAHTQLLFWCIFCICTRWSDSTPAPDLHIIQNK